jgi:predicted unusual protein kinase regulating ubiquinone biosynthesis (AarF/ABC1/UbiB family)
VLSTRADLLPVPYLTALSRLQDNIAPFPYAEVEAIVEAELGSRISKRSRASSPHRSPPPRWARCIARRCATGVRWW